MELHTIDIEFDSEEVLYEYAKHLEGMTFNDVLDLGIVPRDGKARSFNPNSKGNYGILLEERYFGYKANNSPEPDFPEAGVELKATCIDARKGGDVAGERLSLTMIPFDKEVPEDLYESHLWHKCRRILLVWYIRDKSLERPYDQSIVLVKLFTPPEADLRIIEADYRLIAKLVREGRAEELSEGLTTYLGAATKGSTVPGGTPSVVSSRSYSSTSPKSSS
ncbi:MAG: MutH/Sau3AI family endonuclease [Coriobacteriales bacterium]|nr:MutH/Sau3AI family endonuclease [Coriobacteriales bacterium]